MILKSIQIKVSPNCQHCGSRYRSLAVAMVIAYTEENSGVSKPLPSTTLTCLHFSPASSTQATTCFYFWPSFFISSASSWFQVSSNSSPLWICVQWALCPLLPSTSSEPRYQATTFKYLLSRLQHARASGQLRWKEQTIKMPLPLHFDNTSEFTTDPYILCHGASHLLRATNRVLVLNWHVLLCPEHDCIQTSHYPWVRPSPLSRQTAKAQRDGSACPASHNQRGATHN